jgi:hypothetical protein
MPRVSIMGFALRARVSVLGLGALSVALVACTAGCPSPESPVSSRLEWNERLQSRRELSIDASRSISVKRDVHVLRVHADADQVANAFHQVMRDPQRRFGMIQVDRPEREAGQPFQLGSRFQGRYRLEDGSKFLSELAKYEPAREALCAIENQNTSDYGLIAVLELPPAVRPADAPAHPAPGTLFVLEYRYLEGSPIAGSSRFEVRQITDQLSELSQIFTYQEQTAAFAAFFANGGLTLHNQVVYSQVKQTAALLGVAFEALDIPKAYQTVQFWPEAPAVGAPETFAGRFRCSG